MRPSEFTLYLSLVLRQAIAFSTEAFIYQERQRAGGRRLLWNFDSCSLPVTGPNLGLRQEHQIKNLVAPIQEGSESPTEANLLPSALSIAAFFKLP
ncbi:hypothetical protein [Nostoc sp.]